MSDQAGQPTIPITFETKVLRLLNVLYNKCEPGTYQGQHNKEDCAVIRRIQEMRLEIAERTGLIPPPEPVFIKANSKGADEVTIDTDVITYTNDAGGTNMVELNGYCTFQVHPLTKPNRKGWFKGILLDEMTGKNMGVPETLLTGKECYFNKYFIQK